MSVKDFFFGDNDTKQTTKLPKYQQEAAKNVIDYTQRIGSEPYQPYGGARVAGFNPMQKRAFDQINQNQGAWKQNLNRADRNTQRAMLHDSDKIKSGNNLGWRKVSTDQWKRGALNQYMDPYNEAVIDSTLASFDRQRAKDRNAIGLNAAMAGSFGGARHGIREAEYDVESLLGRAMQEAQLRSQGYGQAADLFERDKQRQLAAQQFNQDQRARIHAMNRDHSYRDQYANNSFGLADAGNRMQGAFQLAGLGKERAGLGYADATAKLGIGDRKQALNQTAMDVAYDDWLQQMYRDPEWRANLMIRGATGVPSERTVEFEGRSPNYGGQLIGAAGGLSSILGGLF